jgi:hypothetical protein
MDCCLREESVALRVQKSAKGGVVAFTLSGRIRTEEVAELQRLFEAEGEDRRIVLDLKEVKLVDRDAVRFLARCEAQGVRLKNCPPYIREWIKGEGPCALDAPLMDNQKRRYGFQLTDTFRSLLRRIPWRLTRYFCRDSNLR